MPEQWWSRNWRTIVFNQKVTTIPKMQCRAGPFSQSSHELVHPLATNHQLYTTYLQLLSSFYIRGVKLNSQGALVSVGRFLCFPFNQLSIKACIPRCVYSLANQITWMNQGCWEQPENQQTQRPSRTGVWHLCSTSSLEQLYPLSFHGENLKYALHLQ